jgi:hypothetical protein
MTTNNICKFSKVSIRIKSKGGESSDGFNLFTVTYENSGLTITGNFMIVTIAEKDDSNKSIIFSLDEIYDYKTYNI